MGNSVICNKVNQHSPRIVVDINNQVKEYEKVSGGLMEGTQKVKGGVLKENKNDIGCNNEANYKKDDVKNIISNDKDNDDNVNNKNNINTKKETKEVKEEKNVNEQPPKESEIVHEDHNVHNNMDLSKIEEEIKEDEEPVKEDKLPVPITFNNNVYINSNGVTNNINTTKSNNNTTNVNNAQNTIQSNNNNNDNDNDNKNVNAFSFNDQSNVHKEHITRNGVKTEENKNNTNYNNVNTYDKLQLSFPILVKIFPKLKSNSNELILFQSHLYKLINLQYKKTKTYTDRFCFVTKEAFVMFNTKESFLHSRTPLGFLPIDQILKAMKFKMDENGKKYDHFYISFKKNVLTKKFYTQINKHFFKTDESEALIMFKSDDINIIHKWFLILNYLICTVKR